MDPLITGFPGSLGGEMKDAMGVGLHLAMTAGVQWRER